MTIMRLFSFILVSLAMIPISADAWMWSLPAKVDGVFYLDHFGGYYCYNDIELMDVSEKARSFATRYANKPVTLNVTRSYQVSIPGEIRIEEFPVAESAEANSSQQNHIRLSASWLLSKKGTALKLNVSNIGSRATSVYPGIIDFFVSTTRDHEAAIQRSMDVSNGPSTIIGWERIFGNPQRTWHGSYSRDQKLVAWSVRDWKQIKDTVLLLPNRDFDIIVDLKSSCDAFDLFFGYKVPREGSYAGYTGVNDVVMPTISNGLVLNSSFLYQLPWFFWLIALCLVGFLPYCVIVYIRTSKRRLVPLVEGT
jgi:hypothetical protein